MTKKEQAEMEELRTKLALHLYAEVKPDMGIPDSFNTILNGWTYNEYTEEVRKACTSSISHRDGGVG
jgi:hypothetical protein